MDSFKEIVFELTCLDLLYILAYMAFHQVYLDSNGIQKRFSIWL